MKIPITLLLCFVGPSLLAQNKSVELTVVRPDTSVQSNFKSHLLAILPYGEEPRSSRSNKIKFYARPVPFELRGKQGMLTWFSYTNPPEDEGRFYTEADQPVLGSLLYEDKLYVCSSRSIQSSIPVVNELLSSTGSEPLTKAEALSIALLFAKCSDTVQIYGDEKSSFFSEEAQEKMGKVAVPPVAKTVNGQIAVTFYSWSALPAGEVSKWSFSFQGNQLAKVRREPISVPRGQVNWKSPSQSGSILFHESGHFDPPKPQ